MTCGLRICAGLLALSGLACPAPMPQPQDPDPAFSVFIPPAGETVTFSISQGGQGPAEAGTAELRYDVVMNAGFSGEEMVLSVDLPAGVEIEPLAVDLVTAPFSLEPGGVRSGNFAIRADDTAEPGEYASTLTVTGRVQPGGESQTQAAVFTLTVTPREGA